MSNMCGSFVALSSCRCSFVNCYPFLRIVSFRIVSFRFVSSACFSFVCDENGSAQKQVENGKERRRCFYALSISFSFSNSHPNSLSLSFCVLRRSLCAVHETTWASKNASWSASVSKRIFERTSDDNANLTPTTNAHSAHTQTNAHTQNNVRLAIHFIWFRMPMPMPVRIRDRKRERENECFWRVSWSQFAKCGNANSTWV